MQKLLVIRIASTPGPQSEGLDRFLIIQSDPKAAPLPRGPPGASAEAGRVASAEAGRAGSAEAGRVASAEAGRVASAEAGRVASAEAGRVASAETGLAAIAETGLAAGTGAARYAGVGGDTPEGLTARSRRFCISLPRIRLSVRYLRQ